MPATTITTTINASQQLQSQQPEQRPLITQGNGSNTTTTTFEPTGMPECFDDYFPIEEERCKTRTCDEVVASIYSYLCRIKKVITAKNETIDFFEGLLGCKDFLHHIF